MTSLRQKRKLNPLMRHRMTNPQYLGDGAYCHINEYGHLVLTTGHHEPQRADNIIVLEPEVLAALEKYILNLKTNLEKHES